MGALTASALPHNPDELLRGCERTLRVITDRRDARAMTVGLPSTAERLDLLGQSGSLPFDSFRARRVDFGTVLSEDAPRSSTS
jgi:hypothetical protein